MQGTFARYCQTCGRKELPANKKCCPDCGEKVQKCSRYEWFLADELKRRLDFRSREYCIQEQYPLHDHRGFNWYFDIYVWVQGASIYDGYGELIEVNGDDHKKQKLYRGPGGGYTRDDDKKWELINSSSLREKGIYTRTLSNEQCAKKGGNVYRTADAIIEDLIHRADTWC
ncbi:MAG: hypothetical protein Fur0042_14580 [Cyanophyceae cyanobacterium]